VNMYRHELQSLRKATVIWTVAMIALAGLYFGIYSTVVKDAAGFTQILNSYPASVRAALGVSIANITSMMGYYAIIYTLIALCAAIQAMIYGTSILSKESRERTADFLLVKPVSRSAIVSAKLLASLSMLVLTDVVYFLAALVLAELVKGAAFSVEGFLLLNLTILFLQLIFLAIGLAISVFFARLKNVLPISLGVVLGFYILGALIATGDNGSARYLSPFRYFDAQYIIAHSSYELSYLWISTAIVAVGVGLSYIVYGRKDVHSVS